MKKTIITFLMTIMPLLVIADDVEVNGIFYKFDTTNQTASVSSNPNKYQGDIVIPEAVTYEDNQYSVTSIGPGAFYQCTGLTSVTFPNSLTCIEMSAFEGCTSLPTSFVIPESIRSIGRSAFSGTNIVVLTICGGTSIEKYAFICQNLTTLKLLHNAYFYDSALAGSPISEIYFYSDAKPDINIDAFGIPPGEEVLKKIIIYVQPKFVEDLKGTNPWKAFAKILPIPGQTFKLTYLVDGEIFKTCELSEGDAITPVPEPIKEGYTFSGWSDIPATMPAKDITVTGSFTINKYKLIYMVDGVEYRKYDVEYGVAITPEPEPTKEGYCFSGWSDIPATMPAKDVLVNGRFTQIDNPQPQIEPEQNITKDHVVYKIEGDYVVVIQTDNASGGVKIEPYVVIDGNTYTVTSIGSSAFKGCTAIISVEIPNTIAAIGEKAFDGCTGLCTVIIGSGIREIARKAFANIFKQNSRTRGDDKGLHFYCEAEVVPATSAEAFKGTDIANATLHVPDNLVETYKYVAPWNEFGNIVGFSNTGIRTINIDTSDVLIFDMQGNRLNVLRKGVNIVRTRDGITKKIVVR